MLPFHLINTQTLPIPHPIPSADEQILFLQAEHLQVTGSFNVLRKYLAELIATGKHPAHVTDILAPAVKIAPGLWEFKKDEHRHLGIFTIYRQRVIRAGLIHIWNMQTEKYETEMQQTKEKKVYKMYCGNEETYYSADGVEFFTFTSIIH
jgi:hypothetical protein